jgi:hypothetical protein
LFLTKSSNSNKHQSLDITLGAFATFLFEGVDGAESMRCGGGRCNWLIGNGRAATGNKVFNHARIILKFTMVLAKGFLLSVMNSSHFKSLMAGRKSREVHFPVMKLG